MKNFNFHVQLSDGNGNFETVAFADKSSYMIIADALFEFHGLDVRVVDMTSSNFDPIVYKRELRAY